ncbi:phage virion morphogenesis protein [Polaribacter sp. MSW13]|uniref:Phage virion morphogenesis protein n=1 Tax=Polaribacter marinus TaxID=2916838 RepID=A0A9X1VRQ5_9FLAO|nr:phage virion morphogenesis protein [Polaribacter marinus]MCI2229570.1 phage virion morphogenesis protein [Polaribacter marinus]
MGKINKTPDFLKMATTLKKDVVRYAAVAGVNFFQDSFQNQGFTDEFYEAWDKRKNDVDPGRNVLVKSSFLLNSIQVFDKNEKRITFGSDAEHAEIHNNGGTIKITITKKARRYFWLMFKVTGATTWKAMALTKKTSITITIPKRQFIGESKTFLKELDTWIITEILKRFKNL